jgi:hypothetical protein
MPRGYRPPQSPPRTEFWARVEEARRQLNMSNREFSIAALGPSSGSTYGNIAGRNNWHAHGDTMDAIVKYLTSRGYSREWVYSTSSGEPSLEETLTAEGFPSERAEAAIAGARSVAMVTDPNGASREKLLSIARALLLPAGKHNQRTPEPARNDGASNHAHPLPGERAGNRVRDGKRRSGKGRPSSLPPSTGKQSRKA